MTAQDFFFKKLNDFQEIQERRRIAQKLGVKISTEISLEILHTLETCQNFLKDATILLDIGAHKGKFTQGANLFFDLENSICFEPNTPLHSQIKANNTGNSLIIEQTALSDKKGEISFYLHEDDTMNSTVEADDDVLRANFPWDNPDKMNQITVPTDTLDNYIKEKGLLDKTFFIKIDTQGNELDIFRHSNQTLAQTEICLVEFMFLTPYKSKYTFMELISFMNEHDFTCQGALTIAKRPSKKVSAVDFLFVKNK